MNQRGLATLVFAVLLMFSRALLAQELGEPPPNAVVPTQEQQQEAPQLAGPEFTSLLMLTAGTAVAGVAGAVAGAVAGVLVSGVVVVPSALVVKLGLVSHAQSTVAIQIFMAAPLVFGIAGAVAGAVAARAVTAWRMKRGFTSSTPVLVAAFLGFDALLAVLLGGPITALALTPAVIAWMVVQPRPPVGYGYYPSGPTERQTAVAIGLGYGAVLLALLVPPALMVVALGVPITAAIVSARPAHE